MCIHSPIELCTSLLQYVVETCPRTPVIIELFLSLPGPIGLQPSRDGLTALHAAMAEGGWRAMQLMMRAIIDGRIAFWASHEPTRLSAIAMLEVQVAGEEMRATCEELPVAGHDIDYTIAVFASSQRPSPRSTSWSLPILGAT